VLLVPKEFKVLRVLQGSLDLRDLKDLWGHRVLQVRAFLLSR
jgi:hypothetical protein